MKIIKKVRFEYIKGLRKLKGKITKTKLFGFDIETSENNNHFVCASIVGKDYKFFCYDKDSIKKELASNRIFRGSYICATNLMFDFFGLFNITEAFKSFHIIERGSNIILASTYCRYKEGDLNFYNKNTRDFLIKKKGLNKKDFYKVTFIDSANHLKTSVAVLGSIINYPKLKAPSFLGDEPKNAKEWAIMKKYNIQDSTVTFKFMEFLQDEYNKLGCKLKCTVSSTALDLFRRKYLGKLWKAQDKEKILYEYKGYYGGRTEAFQRGIFNSDNYGTVRSYDVNSLYPYCLKNFRYPIVDENYTKKKVSLDDVDSFMGVGNFKVKAPNDLHIPILPFKTDKLRFPVGIFKGTYDFNSIKIALEQGYEILEQGKGIIYENQFRPFVSMIDNLYKQRLKFKSEKSSAEIVTKLMMNSFYGKLGYRYYDKEFLTNMEGLLQVKEDSSIFPTTDPNIFRVVTSENSYIPPYVFPVIPLYVTSYARGLMFKYFKNVGVKRIIYTDTDCIFTNRHMPTSTELGEMKLEDTYKELAIIKPKFYSGITDKGENIIKVKGIHKSIKDFQHFKQMTMNDSFKLTMTQFRKLRGAMGKPNVWVNQTYEILKEMNINDNKRVWEKPTFTANPQNSQPLKIKI